MSTSKRPRRFFQMPAIDQPDPEPGFQHCSEEFIVPASDEEGESVRMQFRLPGQLHAWVGEIVASKKFPFQRDGDFVRYCVYLGCLQMSRIEKAVPSLQHQLDSMFRLVNQRMHVASVGEHLDQLAKLMERLQKEKAWGEILHMLHTERLNAEGMLATEPFWAKRWQDGLAERFGMVEAHAISQFDLILKEKGQDKYFSLKPSGFVRDRNGDGQ